MEAARRAYIVFMGMMLVGVLAGGWSVAIISVKRGYDDDGFIIYVMGFITLSFTVSAVVWFWNRNK